VHALSGDAASADPAETRRGAALAALLRARQGAAGGGLGLVVYNSAAGRGAGSGVSQVRFNGLRIAPSRAIPPIKPHLNTQACYGEGLRRPALLCLSLTFLGGAARAERPVAAPPPPFPPFPQTSATHPNALAPHPPNLRHPPECPPPPD
jgi:hypothetical protein